MPWLDAELEVVRPEVLMFRVTKQRGVEVDSPLAPHVVATIHPSAILRMQDPERALERAAFVDDLRVAAALLPA